MIKKILIASRLFALLLGFSSFQSPLRAQGNADNTPVGVPNDNANDAATDHVTARPPLWVKGGVRATPFLAVSPSGYTPAQVRHAYDFDKINGDGTGQTIAIVDAYGSSSLAKDLSTFCTTFSLPAATLNVYYPQGQPSTADSGWALETSLDVEWAHVIAPGAKIVVVVAKSASLTNLLKAVDYAVKLGANQVSMSWGAAEFSSEANYDYHFNKTGVSFFASSGDNGAGVMWPAASPYVVGVGGTTLSLDSTGSVISETAWSGSGGGVSAYEVKPAFQNGWQTASKRAVPDVSYDADPNTGFPVYISNYNGSTGWVTVGGTSAGAPQWAGAMALVNSGRAKALSGADAAVYSIASSSYSSVFRDITSGSNTGYNATILYDCVTGLGSPLASALIPALQAQ